MEDEYECVKKPWMYLFEIRLKTLMCTCAPYSEQNIRSVWPVEKSACFIENRCVKHLRIQQGSIVQKFFKVFCSFAFLQGSLHSIRWFWGISLQKKVPRVWVGNIDDPWNWHMTMLISWWVPCSGCSGCSRKGDLRRVSLRQKIRPQTKVNPQDRMHLMPIITPAFPLLGFPFYTV